MARTAKSFNRRESSFVQQATLLIITEDSKSGKRYLEDASRHFRVNAKVEITHCGKTDPRGIVNTAIDRQKKFDRVFCVIDRDAHPKFDEALNQAKTKDKITIIASYPCFEFWLLLHFGYSRKPYAADGRFSAAELVVKDLHSKPGLEDYDKGMVESVFDKLNGEPFATARRVAHQVFTEAESTEEMNPSTAMHKLIDELERLAQLQGK